VSDSKVGSVLQFVWPSPSGIEKAAGCPSVLPALVSALISVGSTSMTRFKYIGNATRSMSSNPAVLGVVTQFIHEAVARKSVECLLGVVGT
jgi:hypothetical protein